MMALIVLCIVLIIPGLVVSYALFPTKKSISKEERLIFSFGLSPGIITFIMFFSATVFNSFDIRLIMSSLILVMVLSGLLFYLQKKHNNSTAIESTLSTNLSHNFPKPLTLIFLGSVFSILFFRFYHALIFPIVGWDSLVEFAYLGRLYFQTNNIPTITGATLGVHSSACRRERLGHLYFF